MANCPKVIHSLMLECWSRDRLKRPKFSDILTTLENWIRNPATFGTSAALVKHEYDKMDHIVVQTVAELLQEINMKRYEEKFWEKCYVNVRQILHLTLDDLEEMGVRPNGHRETIFKAIQKAKGQVLYYGTNEDE